MTRTRLTVQEQATLTSGATFWTTAAVEHAGIAAMVLTDGPHGVRLQRGSADHLGIADALAATCFPPAAGLASAWDPALARRVGAALGAEAAAAGVAVLLGPGVNIKRSPLCGRNFEYLSEDPVLSGDLGAALIDGIQSAGVGASVKHLAANNQETDRLRSSSDVDPRPLREIYLRSFERAIRGGRPWTVMCSYNRINGVYASEDPWLLTTVLREEWGFDGVVVSDWGAVNDRVAGLAAGMDLEMPSSAGRSARQIVAAIEAGTLDPGVLDTAAARIVALHDRTASAPRPAAATIDFGAHHELAREAAARSIVLLRNQDALLPLDPAGSVAVIGAFAADPRYQGAGSSRVNPTRLDVPLDAIRSRAAGIVTYSPGFSLSGDGEASEAAALRDDAVAAARAAHTAVVFLGLPAHLESEGFDRDHLDLPPAQLELLDAVLAANPRTVVVLSNGGVVTLPFAHTAPAILETWLLGQAAGAAMSDVLFGDVSPSGRLPETIPLRIEDTPAFLDFPGEHGHVRYAEGLHVGYRWYDARRLDVAFPFGHGLSYTTFAYGPVGAAVEGAAVEGEDIVVRVRVDNAGDVDSHEVVQAYVSRPASAVQRAPRALAAFAAVFIPAGTGADVELRIPRADLAHWDTRVDRWVVEGGPVEIAVGASSRDLRGVARVEVTGDAVELPVTLESSIGEAMESEHGRPVALEVLAAALSTTVDELTPPRIHAMEAFTLGRLLAFPSVTLAAEDAARRLAGATRPA